MLFSQILKTQMEEHGYTNYRLAKLLDCSQSTVSAWLKGASMPSKARMKQIAKLFNVSVDYMSGNEKAATIDGDGLNELEIEVIQLFRAASPPTRTAMLQLLRSLEAYQ